MVRSEHDDAHDVPRTRNPADRYAGVLPALVGSDSDDGEGGGGIDVDINGGAGSEGSEGGSNGGNNGESSSGDTGYLPLNRLTVYV